MASRPLRHNRKERLQELLGSYDLKHRITLFGPHYLSDADGLAVLVHERSHAMVANVTTYGTIQKALAMVSDRMPDNVPQKAALEDALDWVLDNGFYADEGFAMSRERDYSLLLGNAFDPATMPDDYAHALAQYDELFTSFKPSTPGLKVLMVQGFAEAVFNTSLVRQVQPKALMDGVLDLENLVPITETPDRRLAFLRAVCTPTILEAIERQIIHLTQNRIVVGDSVSSIEQAIVAAYSIPGVRSDQQLRLIYLAASMSVFEELNRARPDVFAIGPEDAIRENLPYLEELRVTGQGCGIDLPRIMGPRTLEDEAFAEGVLYAPQKEEFDVAWALPQLVSRLTLGKKFFFFNSPMVLDEEPPPELPRVADMLLLTIFGMRPNGDAAEAAYWKLQLQVPIEDVDDLSSDKIYEHIVDDVLLLDEEDPLLNRWLTLAPDRKTSIVLVLPNTDMNTIHAWLAAWLSINIVESALLIVTLGPICYFQIRLRDRPRILLRIPKQVLPGLKKALPSQPNLLPDERHVWEHKHLGWLEEILCHLIEAGAFFGEKRRWLDEYVDDLAPDALALGFVDIPLQP